MRSSLKSLITAAGLALSLYSCGGNKGGNGQPTFVSESQGRSDIKKYLDSKPGIEYRVNANGCDFYVTKKDSLPLSPAACINYFSEEDDVANNKESCPTNTTCLRMGYKQSNGQATTDNDISNLVDGFYSGLQGTNCVPNWVTSNWSSCINNTQTRTVTDTNNCNDNTNKPINSQSCSVTADFSLSPIQTYTVNSSPNDHKSTLTFTGTPATAAVQYTTDLGTLTSPNNSATDISSDTAGTAHITLIASASGVTSFVTKDLPILYNQPPTAALNATLFNNQYHPSYTHPGAHAKLNYGNGDSDGTVTSSVLMQISGPANASITNYASTSTADVGFPTGVSGDYAFDYKVYDDKGASRKATSTVRVWFNSAPVANDICPLGTVNIPAPFDGSGSNDSDGSIVSCSWNWGNGDPVYTETPTNAPDGTFDCKTTHTYSVVGNYNVILTVTDDDNATRQTQCWAAISP